MMNERILKAFEECERFIDEHTPEELVEYEESLNLDYEKYSDGITFSDYIELGSKRNSIQSETTYSNSDSITGRISYKISNTFFATAA